MRFVSHLDLIRLFQRALRRAGLPVTITKGFSPHLKMSIARALKLGLESDHEEAIICMDEPVEAGRVIKLLNEQLPEGIRLTGAEEIG
jgi:radical SAM-linked protein